MLRTQRAGLAACVIAVLAGAGLCSLAGCKRDSTMSDKEIKQIRSGAPPEMPPEAKAYLERMRSSGGQQGGGSGRMTPGGPPPTAPNAPK